MTNIPVCQDLELLKAPFLNSQFIICLKIPNPFLIKNQEVRAKIHFGFKVKGSSQLTVIALVCEWKLNISHCKQGLFKYSRVTE